MPFVVESSSATAAQHESDRLYAELVQVLSRLKIPALPEHSIEDIDQASPSIDTVDGEIVADIEKSQPLQLEDSSAKPILPEEKLAGRLRGGDDPQLLEVRPIRLLAPSDEIRLEVGDETIKSGWAAFPEALKQLPQHKITDVCQAVKQPGNMASEQISNFDHSSGDSVDAVDPINLTVNGVLQFQRSESSEIALNNLYPAVVAVQAETAENQTNQPATVQQKIVEASDTLTEPKTIDVEAVVLPTIPEAISISIPQDELIGAAVDNAFECSDSAASPLIIEPENSQQLQPLKEAMSADQLTQNLQEVAVEAPKVKAEIIPPMFPIDNTRSLETEPPESRPFAETVTPSFTTAEFPSEEINYEPENQLLPLGEIERVTGQEIGSGPLHNQIIQQSPSMTAHRNASGQFTATQSIKAHVEATEDEVETEAILQTENLQVENQEEQPVNVGLPIQPIGLSAGDRSTFGRLDSFLQHNQDLVEGAISDRTSGVVIQSQDNGGFVATNADGQILSFDGNHATGDSGLIRGVSELAQKTISAALAYNAQAAQRSEDIEHEFNS